MSPIANEYIRTVGLIVSTAIIVFLTAIPFGVPCLEGLYSVLFIK